MFAVDNPAPLHCLISNNGALQGSVQTLVRMPDATRRWIAYSKSYNIDLVRQPNKLVWQPQQPAACPTGGGTSLLTRRVQSWGPGAGVRAFGCMCARVLMFELTSSVL